MTPGLTEILLLIFCLLIPIILTVAIFIQAMKRRTLGYGMLLASVLLILVLLMIVASGAFFDPIYLYLIIIFLGLGGIIRILIERGNSNQQSTVMVQQVPLIHSEIQESQNPQAQNIYNINVQNIQDSVVMQDDAERN